MFKVKSAWEVGNQVEQEKNDDSDSRVNLNNLWNQLLNAYTYTKW